MVRILIVTGDPSVAASLELGLKTLGYRVTDVVSSVRNALDSLQNHPVDLALLDLNVKGSPDIFEVASAIQKEKGLSLLFTGYCKNEECLQKAKSLEPYGILPCPFEKIDLFAAVEMSLLRHSLETKLARHELEPRLTNTPGMAVLMTDQKGMVRYMNLQAEHMLCTSLERSRGVRIDSLVRLVTRKERHDKENPIFRALRENRTVTSGDLSLLVSRTGVELVVLDVASPMTGEDGETEALIFLHDLTERIEFQSILQETESHYRTIINSTSEGFWLMNGRRETLDVNDALCRILGYSRDELVGKSPISFLGNGEREHFLKSSGSSVQWDREITFHTKSGDYVDVLYSETVIRNEEGSANYVFAFLRDITLRKESERDLAESESRYRAIFDKSRLAQLVLEPDTERIIDANPTAGSFYGLSREELLESKLSDLTVVDQYKIRDDLEKSTWGEEGQFSYKQRAARGEIRDVDIHFTPIEIKGVRVLHAVIYDITELKQTLQSLQETREKFNTVVDLTFDWEYWIGPDRKYRFVSLSFERITGYKSSELMENPRLFQTITHPDDLDLIKNHFDNEFVNDETHSFDFRIITKSGQVRWINHTCQRVYGEDGKDLGRRANNRDITDIRHREEQLGLTLRIIENTLEGMIITDEQQKIISVNPAFTRVTGYSEQEVLGKTPRIVSSGRHKKLFFKNMWDSIQKSGEWQGEIWNRRKNGEIYPEWLHIVAVKGHDGKVKNFVGIFTDITTRKQAESRLNYLANHDTLTGLPNRSLFYDRLFHSLTQANRKGSSVAVVIMDLDRFKFINETLGHHVGDELLKIVARRLRSSLRDEDTISRLGGDEFGILLDDIHSPQDAAVVARKLVSNLTAPCEVEGDELFVTPSIGITIFPVDGRDARTLLRNTDTALQRAKTLGRNNYQFYENEMNSTSLERFSLENNLRYALKREEFILHYQPLVDLKSGELVGMEALIRWNHPELGLVYPNRFIPIAEEAGLIISIGTWVLRAVSEQIRDWKQKGLRSPGISFNFSASQFRQKNLVEEIGTIMDEYRVEPSDLNVEITESVAMDNIEYTIQMLKAMNGRGLDISIDDFGTGHSSLAYLKRFPISKLKIDRSFVQDIGQNPDNEAIVSAIVAMAHSMKLKVVAEGVENEKQLNFLKNLGCDMVQGFHFSYPLPAGDMEELIRSDRRFEI